MVLQFWISSGIAAVCFTTGTLLFLYIRRRIFYRTNAAGVQEFKNYRSSVVSRFFEGVLLFVAVLLFARGAYSALAVLAMLIMKH